MEVFEPTVAFWVTAMLGPPLVFCACALAVHMLFGRERRSRRRPRSGSHRAA
jgi:hypothetical protein